MTQRPRKMDTGSLIRLVVIGDLLALGMLWAIGPRVLELDMDLMLLLTAAIVVASITTAIALQRILGQQTSAKKDTDRDQ